jgi:hypothetical protein
MKYNIDSFQGSINVCLIREIAADDLDLIQEWSKIGRIQANSIEDAYGVSRAHK